MEYYNIQSYFKSLPTTKQNALISAFKKVAYNELLKKGYSNTEAIECLKIKKQNVKMYRDLKDYSRIKKLFSECLSKNTYPIKVKGGYINVDLSIYKMYL
jgi:hypothetical protein